MRGAGHIVFLFPVPRGPPRCKNIKAAVCRGFFQHFRRAVQSGLHFVRQSAGFAFKHENMQQLFFLVQGFFGRAIRRHFFRQYGGTFGRCQFARNIKDGNRTGPGCEAVCSRGVSCSAADKSVLGFESVGLFSGFKVKKLSFTGKTFSSGCGVSVSGCRGCSDSCFFSRSCSRKCLDILGFADISGVSSTVSGIVSSAGLTLSSEARILTFGTGFARGFSRSCSSFLADSFIRYFSAGFAAVFCAAGFTGFLGAAALFTTGFAAGLAFAGGCFSVWRPEPLKQGKKRFLSALTARK